MIEYQRTSSANNDFKHLIARLDALLRILDGDDHAFYAALNKTDHINEVIVAYSEGIAVGCGALRPYEKGVAEIKRMFVQEAYRGRGIAGNVLHELELWAKELGYHTCVLETGIRQTAATRLYQKSGYQVVENYGKYKGVEASVCFEKRL